MSLVECPICMDYYGGDDSHERAPRILSCGHTICTFCLKDLYSRKGEEVFQCPICRKVVDNNNKPITELPINRYVYDVLRDKGLIENNNDTIITSSSNQNFDYKFQIIFLGTGGVGKSCIIHRFVENEFQEGLIPVTLNIDFKVKVMKIRNKTVQLTIKDTAGQERYQSLAFSSFRNSQGAFFVYDCTDKVSLDGLKIYIENYLNQNCMKIRSMILVANKVDLPKKREVSEEEGRNYAEKYKMRYIETSAKENTNIERIFKNIVVELMIQSASLIGEEIQVRGSSLVYENPRKGKKYKKNCCGGKQ